MLLRIGNDLMFNKYHYFITYNRYSCYSFSSFKYNKYFIIFYCLVKNNKIFETQHMFIAK